MKVEDARLGMKVTIDGLPGVIVSLSGNCMNGTEDASADVRLDTGAWIGRYIEFIEPEANP